MVVQHIQHSLNAVNFSRRFEAVSSSQAKTLERTPSENNINKVEDAARLSISDGMRNKARNLNSSVEKAQESITTMQKAEDSLSKIYDNLQRMRECAVEGSDESKEEMELLSEESNSAAEYTVSYSTMPHSGGMDYATLASDYAKEENNARVEKNKCNFGSDEYNEWDRREAYWRSRKLECKKLEQLNDTDVNAIDEALAMVSEQMTSLSEERSKVEEAILNSDKEVENKEAAKEMVEMAKKNILAQANQAMLAQANQMTQSVMLLLQ